MKPMEPVDRKSTNVYLTEPILSVLRRVQEERKLPSLSYTVRLLLTEFLDSEKKVSEHLVIKESEGGERAG